MLCETCGRDVERVFQDGMCGICQMTVYQKGPGVIGLDYPYEANPEKYDAAKEQRIAIRFMESCGHDNPNHIDSKTAARWKKVFVERAERDAALEARVPERVRRASDELHDHMERVQREEVNQKAKLATEGLMKVDAKIKSGELPL